jgi:signal transduction histidine kinase
MHPGRHVSCTLSFVSMTPAVAEPLKEEIAPPAPTLAAMPPPAPVPPEPELVKRGLLARFRAAKDAVIDWCVPQGFDHDHEPYRRGRLITGFGVLGFVFGCCYAGFYLAIGHIWGAAIIAVCSIGVATMPLVLRATRSTKLPGHLLTAILLAGFTALCSIEGGARGHAIAWLAAVPLCGFLLVGSRSAIIWCALSIAVTVAFVVLDLLGIHMPLFYAPRWNEVVTAVGYMGLTIFFSLLGLIFEGGRRRAFAKMEHALDEVSQFNTRLKRLDAEKNEFLGVAAHDLKNPLGIVMGFAEMIASGRSRTPDRDRDDARNIIAAAERMISLITQLLDVNAIEQGRFPLEIEICDLGQINSAVVASFQAAAERKHISIYAAGSLMPVRVFADPKATWRVLDNLLSNAIKYSPAGRDIFVRLRETPDGALWEVQDQGPGLTEADQAKLFQKFTKLSARPTGGESSTGLGLSIVKMLAVQMHGTVECRSTPGQGATFAVRLPSADQPVHDAPIAATA